jgi:excisionase family DNA binding protein
METVFTPDEVAEILKIDVATVQELIATNQLGSVRLGNHVRIRETDLRNCLQQSTAGRPEIAVENGARFCRTFGGRAKFRVEGSIENGARIWPGSKAQYPIICSKEFFESLLKKHRGQTIRAGLSFSDPGAGTLGAYVQKELKTMMNPTAYIAGLLVNEGYAERSERGYISFFSRRKATDSAA